ncbi:MAG: hypothetical protein JWO36_3938 [Myxococcales bacterium]|nr:hypothetical protein [Myxococcales bacterium]
MRARWISTAVLVAACGFPQPGRVNGDGGTDGQPGIDTPVTCTECQLVAVRPAVANTGATLTLEGTFADAVDVTFPGGAHVAAAVLGTHRATVIVPASATAGLLTVSSGGATSTQPFRRASFQLGLSHFYPYEQADTARQMPVLVQPRRGHNAAVVGGYVYVFGGEDGSSSTLGSVERALINADGTLQTFAQVGTLATARKFATCVVVGGMVYLIGGLDATGRLIAAIEAAPVQADGSLGPFATVSGLTLVAARQGATAEVIGDYVYVIGGADRNGAADTLERAPIHTDGTLGAFAVETGATLATPRSVHTSVVIGNSLYVIGGETNGTLIATVEQATIAADGSVGAFSTLAGSVLLNPRESHTSFVLGNQLYILGGAASALGAENIESAPIDATNGSLGAFTLAGTWTTARQLGAGVIVGNFVYEIGGQKFNQVEATIERASIDAIGSLGTPSIQNATLDTQTDFGCSAVIGNHVYLIGGYTGSDSYTIQAAAISADGALGGFTLSTDRLAVARETPACAVIGNYLYVIGGYNALTSPRPLDSIERAPIQPDGTLGSFTLVSGNHLVTPRGGHRMLVLGTQLYVLGGIGQVGPPATGSEIIQNTAEVATITSTGSLGAFQQISQPILTNPRTAFVALQLGAYVYLIGGSDSNGYLSSIDYIPLTQQGTIGGSFSAAPTRLAVPRAAFTVSMIGDQLFVIGGRNVTSGGATYLTTIEEATVAATGQLGSFPNAPAGGTLSSPHFGHISGVTGNHAWHAGGGNGIGAPVNTIDQSVLP